MKVTEQALHVINSLSGKPSDLVAEITAILPELIKAVEESGWIKIDEDHQPPNNELVRIWNDAYKEEMTGKYIPRFSVNTEDQYLKLTICSELSVILLFTLTALKFYKKLVITVHFVFPLMRADKLS